MKDCFVNKIHHAGNNKFLYYQFIIHENVTVL